ncbi:MAG: DUF1800 domain-containing protein [Edaphobacter sp.]|uniref:DUF1800 domain-containing protein n=1 Tax=Edaphobacter sp. TaxID=1934404 RepID=UPI00239E2EE7|nr:DUF1800 domain-containing protein [Edaphobacter sp.]MDE1178402.1 DUF1800 domain-containing protein [Edaphobacter sp.]
MVHQSRQTKSIRRSLEAAIAAMLSAVLVLQPLPAWAAKRKVVKLQGDERIVHALNRLTFGPRPGEVATVRRIGLDRWFALQLHPESIDDSALEARLDQYPAMRLQQADLLQKYPTPQILRLVDQKKLPMPADPMEVAIYRDGIARLQQKKEQKKEMAAPKAALPGDGVDPATPSMAVHEQQLYRGLDTVRIVNLSPSERMQAIISLAPEQVAAFQGSLTPVERNAMLNGLAPEQREVVLAITQGPQFIDNEVTQTRLLRDAYSSRQLQAVMTDFWLNHFNVYARKNQNEPWLLTAYERDAIRLHALGRFEDLLVATAKSPAMLEYLDNAQSLGPNSPVALRNARGQRAGPNRPRPQGVNENYARELMELHTLGVNGGYTQADVTAVARVFTGWTVEPQRGGEFSFDARRHEPGPKTVMGKTIPAGGEDEGLQVLHQLAASPATARFISNKLAVRFVSDTPSPALVDRMTKAYLKSDGDIAAVLKAMFSAPEFWSQTNEYAKVKTPLEFVISSIRATNAEVTDPLPLVRTLDRLGMPLYGMQTPNGYSWQAEPWVSTGALVNRMNFAVALSGNRLPGTTIRWPSLLNEEQGVVRTAALSSEEDEKKEARLELLLLERAAPAQTRSAVLAQVVNRPAQMEAEKRFPIRLNDNDPMGRALNPDTGRPQAQVPVDRDAALMGGLLLGSPEFQRR